MYLRRVVAERLEAEDHLSVRRLEDVTNEEYTPSFCLRQMAAQASVSLGCVRSQVPVQPEDGRCGCSHDVNCDYLNDKESKTFITRIWRLHNFPQDCRITVQAGISPEVDCSTTPPF